MITDETWANKQVMGLFQQTLAPGTKAENAETAGTLLSMRMPRVYAYLGWLLGLIGIAHGLIPLFPSELGSWPTWLVLAAMVFYIALGAYLVLFVRRHRVLYNITGFHRIGLFGKIRSHHWTDVRSAVLLRQGRSLVLRTHSAGKVELSATMLGFSGFLAVLNTHCPIIRRERGQFPGQWKEKPWQGR